MNTPESDYPPEGPDNKPNESELLRLERSASDLGVSVHSSADGLYSLCDQEENVLPEGLSIEGLQLYLDIRRLTIAANKREKNPETYTVYSSRHYDNHYVLWNNVSLHEASDSYTIEEFLWRYSIDTHLEGLEGEEHERYSKAREELAKRKLRIKHFRGSYGAYKHDWQSDKWNQVDNSADTPEGLCANIKRRSEQLAQEEERLKPIIEGVRKACESKGYVLMWTEHDRWSACIDTAGTGPSPRPVGEYIPKFTGTLESIKQWLESAKPV